MLTGSRSPPRPTIRRQTPWLLAVLLHTISAPNNRQEPRWAAPPRWSGALTRRSIYGPHGKDTPSGPGTSRTSTRGQSRTPVRLPPSGWPNGDSRTHSG